MINLYNSEDQDIREKTITNTIPELYQNIAPLFKNYIDYSLKEFLKIFSLNQSTMINSLSINQAQMESITIENNQMMRYLDLPLSLIQYSIEIIELLLTTYNELPTSVKEPLKKIFLTKIVLFEDKKEIIMSMCTKGKIWENMLLSTLLIICIQSK